VHIELFSFGVISSLVSVISRRTEEEEEEEAALLRTKPGHLAKQLACHLSCMWHCYQQQSIN
jgi:hypothetical protein